MLYTTTETAEKLGITPQTLRRWDKAGKIVAKKTVGGHRRYDDSDINRVLNYDPDVQNERYKVWSDVKYFAEKYCTVRNHTQGKDIPFKFLPSQKTLLNTMESNNFNLVLQYRQAGITSFMGAYLAHQLISTPDLSVGIVNITRQQSQNLLETIRQIIKNLPNYLAPRFKSDMKERFILENNSKIIVLGGNERAFVGRNFDLIFIDGADFILEKDFWASFRLSTKQNGRILINSSINPNNKNTIYSELTTMSQEGKNGYKFTSLDWWTDPRFNADLYAYKKVKSVIIDTVKTLYYTDNQLNIDLCRSLITEGYTLSNLWLENMIKNVGETCIMSEFMCKRPNEVK